MWNWFKSLFVKPTPSEPIVLNTPDVSNWKVGMWVVVENKVGILHKITPAFAEVHIVDINTGETISEIKPALNALRQCRWLEIPECRRQIDRERGRELGYGD